MKYNFKELSISTQTVMAYINCEFEMKNITKRLTEYIENSKNNPDHNGKILSIKAPSIFYTDTETGIGDAKKGKHFRNQITVKMLINTKIITIKIFRTGKFHMTGCKEKEHRTLGSVLLLQTIIDLSSNDTPTYIMKLNHTQPHIVLEIVMTNVDFNLGFDIDQSALDNLIQKLNDPSFYSIYESCINTSVNIKMEYKDPPTKTFETITLLGNNNFKYGTTDICPDIKPKNTRTHTFLVFSSSKVIQSGRFYNTEMEPAYNKFIDFIYKHRNEIELKTGHEPFDLSKLKCFNSTVSK